MDPVESITNMTSMPVVPFAGADGGTKSPGLFVGSFASKRLTISVTASGNALSSYVWCPDAFHRNGSDPQTKSLWCAPQPGAAGETERQVRHACAKGAGVGGAVFYSSPPFREALAGAGWRGFPVGPDSGLLAFRQIQFRVAHQSVEHDLVTRGFGHPGVRLANHLCALRVGAEDEQSVPTFR